MQVFFRIAGCLIVLACSVGLALQQPTAADALARGQAAEACVDWPQALAWYAEASTLAPDDPAPLLAGARLRLWGGRPDRAAADWARAARLAPHAPALWLLGGQVAEAQGDARAAAADDERAITLAPASPEADAAATHLVRMALAAGTPERALPLISPVPHPSASLRAVQALALAHMDAGDAAQALVTDPAVARTLTPAALVALADWAGTAHDEAALGYADLTLGWPRLALGPLRRAVVAAPTYGAGWTYLAWAFAQVGDLADARLTLAHAQQLAPDAPATVGIAAQVRAAGGDPHGALAELLAWQAGHAPAPALWTLTAQLATQTGDWATAESAYWSAATTPAATDHAGALLDLASFYVATGLGMPSGRAQWAVTATVAANPTSARARDLLGQWQTMARQPEAARATFVSAIRLAPRFAAAHAHLARLAERLGAGETARLEAARALALDATSRVLLGPLAAQAPDDSLAI